MIRLVLALLLVLLPAAAGAQTVIQGTTPAGIRFALAPRPANPLVVISFSWRDGFGETLPGREGLSGVAAAWHMAGPLGSTEAEFREELRDEGVGLSLGAFNGHAFGTLSAPRDRIDKAAERLRAVLLTPALEERTLARIKRQRRAGLAQARETPGSTARTAALSLVAPDTPFLLELIAPARSTAAEVTRADVDAWRTAVLTRDNLVVAAGGPIAEPDLARLVDRIFADLPERSSVPDRPRVALSAPGRTIVIERPAAQTTIVLAGGTRLDPRDLETGLRASLANQVLSSGPASRLFRAVRGELGASYGSSSELVTIGAVAQAFLITTAVDHALAGKALAALRGEYERFHRDGVTDAEVTPLKARLVAGAEESLGRSEIAGRLRAAMAAGRDPTEVLTLSQRVAGITAADINAVIAERLPAPPLATVIVAPSAEGIAADCVVRRDQALEACL